MSAPTEGDLAWAGLAGYVVAYDVWAIRTGNETLSSSYFRALQHPIRRWPTVLFAIFIILHLYKVLPPRYDPLRRPFLPPR